MASRALCSFFCDSSGLEPTGGADPSPISQFPLPKREQSHRQTEKLVDTARAPRTQASPRHQHHDGRHTRSLSVSFLRTVSTAAGFGLVENTCNRKKKKAEPPSAVQTEFLSPSPCVPVWPQGCTHARCTPANLNPSHHTYQRAEIPSRPLLVFPFGSPTLCRSACPGFLKARPWQSPLAPSDRLLRFKDIFPLSPLPAALVPFPLFPLLNRWPYLPINTFFSFSHLERAGLLLSSAFVRSFAPPPLLTHLRLPNFDSRLQSSSVWNHRL